MKDAYRNYHSEIEQLKESLFTNPTAVKIRIYIISFVGLLIFIETNYISSILWPIYFVFAKLCFMRFVKTRRDFVSIIDMIVVSALYLNLQIAYCWLPVFLAVTTEGREFVTAGFILVGYLFLQLQRADTTKLFIFIQITVAFTASIIVLIEHLGQGRESFVIGIILAGINLVFVESLYVARATQNLQKASMQQVILSRKSAAITQMVGGVSHKLNNNLTSLLGAIEMVKLDTLSPEQRTDIEFAMASGNEAAATIKKLMTYAHLDQSIYSVVDLKKEHSKIHFLIKQSLPFNIIWNAEIPSTDCNIQVDLQQLQSSLEDLAANSSEAMPGGGTLTLRYAQRFITVPEVMANGSKLGLGAYIQIIVSDTGHGIPKDDLPYVIDPFFTTKAKTEGAGLGLSVVASTIKRFNGGLSIESSENGTRINLFFPKVHRT